VLEVGGKARWAARSCKSRRVSLRRSALLSSSCRDFAGWRWAWGPCPPCPSPSLHTVGREGFQPRHRCFTLLHVAPASAWGEVTHPSPGDSRGVLEVQGPAVGICMINLTFRSHRKSFVEASLSRGSAGVSFLCSCCPPVVRTQGQISWHRGSAFWAGATCSMCTLLCSLPSHPAAARHTCKVEHNTSVLCIPAPP